MGLKKKKLIIAGGTGLIGKQILSLIDHSQYDIGVLSRREREKEGEIKFYKWNPDQMEIDPEAMKDVDYIINLAGSGVADKRWTSDRKKDILDSRVNSNNVILKALKSIKHKPKAYISASAIGYYGDRGEEVLTEESKVGSSGFLAECTSAWEEAIHLLSDQFERTVIVRVGLVLSTKGGALQKMISPAKFGSAAYFGNGKQFYPWIHIDDISKIFLAAIQNEQMAGIYNGVGPEPAPVKEISTAISKAMKGFSIVHSVPKTVLKIMLGEMANVLFNSSRVIPEALNKLNYSFDFVDLNVAIKDLIERKI